MRDIRIHPWRDGLWVVTVDGRIITTPLPRPVAVRVAVEVAR